MDEGVRTSGGGGLRCVRGREDGMGAEAQTSFSTDENLFWTVYGHRA